MEGRRRPRGEPALEARVRTQSRVALPPNLERAERGRHRLPKTRFFKFPRVGSSDSFTRKAGRRWICWFEAPLRHAFQ
ncbi:MAG: hypothetical protein EOQ32_31870 [Mesorhizobium sp.]|nr:MAG: hypothetical protein EOQ32_31870 [Mesorhizobium sp.]